MSRSGSQPEIVAAGAVVLRQSPRDRSHAGGSPGGLEVLAVHRPRYRDWSLPKGKLDGHELAPVAAVREVREETGASIRLGQPLHAVRYPVSKGTKVVHWWVGHLLGQVDRRPNHEVDQVAWLPLAEAAEKLTYPDEHAVLEQAVASQSGGTVLVVRHGKAMSRDKFARLFAQRPDAERPLSRRGERQALELVPLLDAYGVRQVVSSSSKRCRDTVTPFAAATDQPVRRVDLLSEEAGRIKPSQVRAYLSRLRAHAADDPLRPLLVCGHRPVLPDMFAGLGVANRPMDTAQVCVVHLGADGRVCEVEDWTPLA